MKLRRLLLFLFITILCVSFCGLCPVSAVGEGEKPVIILDPGHGGIDGGTTVGIRTEKVYNFIMAQYLRDLLLQHGGFEVIMTRTDNDTFLKFLPRAINVVKYNGDLLLSLHCNSSAYDYVNGVEAYTSLIDTYAAYDLGNSILARICEKTGMRNRGVLTRADTGDSLGVYYWDWEKNWDMPGASYLGKVSDYFSINTWGSKFGVPSLIVEHGYLSNSGDRALMDQDEILRKIAEAEAEALIEYYYGHTHTFTAEKVVDFPSNCIITGTKSYHCTICGMKAETEPLPAAPDAHFYRQTASSKSSCSEDGFIEYVCQFSYNLNKSLYGNEVHTYKEILPKTEHNYNVTSETLPSSCRDGKRTEVCANCGDTIVTVLPADGEHNYEKTKETPPTCTESGVIEYRCYICSTGYTEEIPAVGHKDDGSGVCAVCGITLSETDAPDTDPHETASLPCSHNFTESDRTEPSCEGDGSVRSVCTLCGFEKEEVLPAEGHRFENVDGDEICSKCGEKKTKSGEERRNPTGLLKNPLFLGVIAVILAQAVLLFVISRRQGRKAHKSRRTAHNVNKHR